MLKEGEELKQMRLQRKWYQKVKREEERVTSMPSKSTTLCIEGSNMNEEEQLTLKEKEELKQMRLQHE